MTMHDKKFMGFGIQISLNVLHLCHSPAVCSLANDLASHSLRFLSYKLKLMIPAFQSIMRNNEVMYLRCLSQCLHLIGPQ